jgi:hypothetical protein
MATFSTYLYNDMTTLANYNAWTTWVSSCFANVGWTQTKETGQVMWSGMSLSQVSMSGTNATYTYGSLVGMPLQVGRALTITGMTNSGNNGAFIITAFTGTTSGTFTVVNAVGVNESGSTGVVTRNTSIPTATATTYHYEFWQPNDSLTPYVLRIEYGTFGGTNSPLMRFYLATQTLGNGTIYGANSGTGFTTYIGPLNTTNLNYIGAGTSVPYQCYFSGDSGRVNCLMWRGGASNSTQHFSIERSVNSSGVYTGTHVTLVSGGANSANSGNATACNQQTLHLTYGAMPQVSNNSWNSTGQGGIACRMVYKGFTGSNPFVNQEVSIDTYAPYIGYFDYPLTNVGILNSFGVFDGQIITTNLYGSPRTYLLTNSGFMPWYLPSSSCMVALRYD